MTADELKPCPFCGGKPLTPKQAIAATLGDNDATTTRQLDAIDEILRVLDAEVTNDNIKYDVYLDLHDMVGELANLIESCAEPIATTVTQDSFIHESGMNEQTCTVESMHGFTDAHVSTRYFVELSCHTIDDWGDREPPKFCPYCGRHCVG